MNLRRSWCRRPVSSVLRAAAWASGFAALTALLGCSGGSDTSTGSGQMGGSGGDGGTKNPGVTVPCSGATAVLGSTEFKATGHVVGVAHDASGRLWIGWTGHSGPGGGASHAYVAFDNGGAWTTKDRGRGSVESFGRLGDEVAATTFAPGSPALAYFERYNGTNWYDNIDLKEYFSSSVMSNASGTVAVAFVWTDAIGDRIGVDTIEGSGDSGKAVALAPLFTPLVNPNEASCTIGSSALDAGGVVYVAGSCSSAVDASTPFVAWTDGTAWHVTNLADQGASDTGSISTGLDGSVTIAWRTTDAISVAPLSADGLGSVRVLDVHPGSQPIRLAMVDATHGYIALWADHQGGIGAGVAYTYFDADGYLDTPDVVAQPGRDQTAVPRGISIDPTTSCPAIGYDAVLTEQLGSAAGQGRIVTLSTP